MITNLRYADDNILLATSEAELQVDRLDRVSRKYSLLINVDKTKVMASDGIACRILIQNELLEQVDTFLYLRSPITEDGECGVAFPMEWMCVATYLLNAESINACRCGVANNSRII